MYLFLYDAKVHLLASTDDIRLPPTCSLLLVLTCPLSLLIISLRCSFLPIYVLSVSFLFEQPLRLLVSSSFSSLPNTSFSSSSHISSLFLFLKNTPSFCLSRTSFFHSCLSLSLYLLSVHFRIPLKYIH